MALTFATAGKHAAKAGAQMLEARSQERVLHAQAAQNPQAAEALARAEEAKTRRSRNRLIAGVAATAVAGTAVFGVAYKVDKGFRDLIGGLKASRPIPVTGVDIQASINKLKLPATLIMVEGDGTATAKVHSRLESSTPIAGQIWNATAARLTDETAWATRTGKDQLLTPLSAMSFGTVKESDGLHAQVRIAGDAVTAQTADMAFALDGKGHEMHSNHQDLPVRLFTSGSQATTASELADWSFENSCSPMLLRAYEPAVQQDARIMLSAAADLEEKSGHTHAASSLRYLAGRSIDVMIYKDVDTLHGSFRQQPISPVDISLPLHAMPQSHDGFTVNHDGGCMPTISALDQFMNLEAQGSN